MITVGREWFNEPRGWRDVSRCLTGRHKAVATMYDGTWFSRCSCGAFRLVSGCWFDGSPFDRRNADGADVPLLRRPSRETLLFTAATLLILALAAWAIATGWAAAVMPAIDDSLTGASA